MCTERASRVLNPVTSRVLDTRTPKNKKPAFADRIVFCKPKPNVPGHEINLVKSKVEGYARAQGFVTKLPIDFGQAETSASPSAGGHYGRLFPDGARGARQLERRNCNHNYSFGGDSAGRGF